MSSKDKTWTAGTLKSRGWTEELIAALGADPVKGLSPKEADRRLSPDAPE